MRAAGWVVVVWGLAWGGLEVGLRVMPGGEGACRLPRETVWLEDEEGTALAAFVGDDEQWHLGLTYEQISPHLIRALVAVEDRRFYEHAGVDWRAAGVAAVQNAAARRIVRGASTLSMQVARLREPRARSWWAKVEQAFGAMQLELRESKREIVTEYVNRAPFGGNLVGAGAASWRYFGKSCKELSLGQAALLAGLPQSPNRFRPDRNVALASIRRDYVLDRMVAAGFISEAQMDQARREPLDVRWRALPQYAEGAVNAGLPTLTWLAGMHSQRTVRTTLSAGMQRQVANLAREQVERLGPSGVTAAAVIVVETQSAECKAAVSISSDSPDVDLVRCARSTGSVLKPFIYAAAFESGQYDRASLVSDSPKSWAGYVPANYDRAFRGTLSAGEALAESRNIPAMTLLASVGVERATGIMESFGLRTLGRSGKHYGLALAIGGAEASPWEVAEAYATLGRGGRHQEIGIWRGAERKAGVQLLTPGACGEVVACLADAERTRQVSPEAARLLPAWKTGTSSGHRDAWCAAVTPGYTVVVWMGNPTGRGTTALVGAEAAAPLALRVLAAIDRGGKVWEMPASEMVAGRRKVAAENRIAVVTPLPEQEVIVRPEEAAGTQQMALTASGGSGEQRWWFVDGARLGEKVAGETMWWAPAAGRHEIRVVDGEGHASAVWVSVR